MANINVNAGDLTDPEAGVVKVGAHCYKYLETNSEASDTTPDEEYEDCPCCESASIEYTECGGVAKIYVDHAALAGNLNPPPPVVEIGGTCYETPVCSETAADTFSIDSTPGSCAALACAPAGSCPGGDPEVDISVTGNTEVINWCGKVFPIGGGTETVCPTTYARSSPSIAAPSELWTHSGAAYGPNLWLERDRTLPGPGSTGELRVLLRPLHYSPFLTTILVPVWYPTYSGLSLYLMSSIVICANSGTATIQYHYYFGTQADPPDILTAALCPLTSDGHLTTAWFGTHQFNGVTYSWSQGIGW